MPYQVFNERSQVVQTQAVIHGEMRPVSIASGNSPTVVEGLSGQMQALASRGILRIVEIKNPPKPAPVAEQQPVEIMPKFDNSAKVPDAFDRPVSKKPTPPQGKTEPRDPQSK